MDMEPNPNVAPAPSPVESPTVPVEPPVAAAASPVPNRFFAKRGMRVLAGVIGVLLLLAGATSLVYLRPPTDPIVRTLSALAPYPAAVVGNHVITIKAYLAERDALSTYFQTEAGQSAGSMPTEDEITKNILETLVHKVAVEQLAKDANVTVDPTRVQSFYDQAVGSTDADTFATQLQTMFGWTPDQFRSRVVEPVVLAMQLGETIGADQGRQADRHQKAQDAHDRLVAGDAFATVADETGGDSSDGTGGDVGYVNMSDLPPEFIDAISALDVGAYSDVLEGDQSYFIFQVTDRVQAGEDTRVKLSIISVPKVTLEEEVQNYLSAVRVWKFIGRS